MKLTQYHRDAIANSVLNDLPKDQDFNQQARELCVEYAISVLPADVARVYKSHPEFIVEKFCYLPRGLSSVQTPGSTDLKKNSSLWKKLEVLAKKATEVAEHRAVLAQKLRSSLASVSTLKQAREAFPEFAKYMPTEVEPNRNLPALRGIVGDLKKTGWPAKKKLA